MSVSRETRSCPVAGCGMPIAGHRLMCKWHWLRVPKPLRDAVWHWLTKWREACSSTSGMHIGDRVATTNRFREAQAAAIGSVWPKG